MGQWTGRILDAITITLDQVDPDQAEGIGETVVDHPTTVGAEEVRESAITLVTTPGTADIMIMRGAGRKVTAEVETAEIVDVTEKAQTICVIDQKIDRVTNREIGLVTGRGIGLVTGPGIGPGTDREIGPGIDHERERTGTVAEEAEITGGVDPRGTAAAVAPAILARNGILEKPEVTWMLTMRGKAALVVVLKVLSQTTALKPTGHKSPESGVVAVAAVEEAGKVERRSGTLEAGAAQPAQAVQRESKMLSSSLYSEQSIAVSQDFCFFLNYKLNSVTQ
jgi:hypothetical protein